jgi:Fe-S-cluster containining protein
MEPINLRSFKLKTARNKRKMRVFLGKIERNPPRSLDKIAVEVEKEIWQEVDCITCANCCKSMTPTFTNKDIARISAHFNLSKSEFKEKWLFQDKKGDWMNTKTPCQFLDKKTNMCSIYDIRPADCAGFPHLAKKKMVNYIDVHKQNVEYCPATYKMVEKMQILFAKK